MLVEGEMEWRGVGQAKVMVVGRKLLLLSSARGDVASSPLSLLPSDHHLPSRLSTHRLV